MSTHMNCFCAGKQTVLQTVLQCDKILMPTAPYIINSNSEENFCKTFKVFHNFHKFFLLATELQLFVLVQVTVVHILVPSGQCECSLTPGSAEETFGNCVRSKTAR